jgi:hypothetical protein
LFLSEIQKPSQARGIGSFILPQILYFYYITTKLGSVTGTFQER